MGKKINWQRTNILRCPSRPLTHHSTDCKGLLVACDKFIPSPACGAVAVDGCSTAFLLHVSQMGLTKKNRGKFTAEKMWLSLLPLAALAAPEYYLSSQGANCYDTCFAQGLNCNEHIDTGRLFCFFKKNVF